MSAVTDRPRVLRIHTRAREPSAILVAVRDSGVRLSPEQMEQLFDAFDTTKPEGSGMGLSSGTRLIAEANGGRLWAAPNEGPGATFQFAVPIGEEDEA